MSRRGTTSEGEAHAEDHTARRERARVRRARHGAGGRLVDRLAPRQGGGRREDRRRAQRHRRGHRPGRFARDHHLPPPLRPRPRGPALPGPPLRGARHGRGHPARRPGRHARLRPPRRDRLLLRHPVPRRPPALLGRLRGDRARDGGDPGRGPAVHALRAPRLRGHGPPEVRGQQVQDRQRRAGRRGGVRAPLVVRHRGARRELGRPVPRSARPEHRADRRDQGAVAGLLLLARRRELGPADARLRRGVPVQEGARRAPRRPRRGEGARPPEHRAAPPPLPHRRGGRAGPRAVDAERRGRPRGAAAVHLGGAHAPGLLAGLHAAHRQARAVPHERPLPVLPGVAVRAARRARLADGPRRRGLHVRRPDEPAGVGRGRGLPAQADELPAPHQDLRQPPPLLPRPARPPGGVRHGVPVGSSRASSTA